MSNKVAGIVGRFFLWILPTLFLIDDVLGCNGYQFTILGKSIRIILFALSVCVLCLYSLWICYKSKITLRDKGNGICLTSLLKPLDCIVFLFILVNGIWAVAIPFAVRGESQFSLKDFSTILVLVLYFPIAFLIRMGKLKQQRIEKMLYFLCILLALWHCIMYIGEVLSPGFYASYYDFIDKVSFGTAVRTQVVYGYGITRVVQTTSVFLIVGLFLSIRYIMHHSYIHIIPMVLMIFSICITYTRSFWIGCIFGIALYVLLMMLAHKEKQQKKKSLIVLLIAIVTVASLNYAFFGNTLFTRMQYAIMQPNSTETTQPNDAETTYPNDTDDTTELGKEQTEDQKGTALSMSLRRIQNEALINKWKQSKWIGYGYGAYAEECIRNESFPYMYESTLPALVMKLGLLGCTIWVVFIGSVTVAACTFFWKRNRTDCFIWVAMAVSFAVAVQTNPFLFTFPGFSVLLYLLVDIQEKQKRIK